MQAEENASSNKSAADILNNLLQRGEVTQAEDGSITVNRGANVIMNQHEVDQ